MKVFPKKAFLFFYYRGYSKRPYFIVMEIEKFVVTVVIIKNITLVSLRID